MPGRRRLCLPLLLAGFVAGCGFVVPRATPTPNDPVPRTTPTPSPRPDPSNSSHRPTSTPSPTASPSPTPDPSALELEALSCEGGVVLDWSPSTDPAFHHYTALRSPARDIETDYPPIAPAVDWGQTYATDAFVTSAVDASIIPSDTTWYYRVMAYASDNEAVGASPVRAARLSPVVDLGELEATEAESGGTRIGWAAYDGFSRCFTAYRVLYGVAGPPTTVLTIVSDQETGAIETDGLHADTTYQLRVQAVRDTTLGSFVVGQTDVVTYTVP